MTEIWIVDKLGNIDVLKLNGGAMAEQKGIKETEEMILAFLKIAQILAVQFKDGIQSTDALEIIKKVMTPELEKIVVDAYNGMNEIPAEIKDISLAEALDLFKVIAPEVMAIVGAVAKKD